MYGNGTSPWVVMGVGFIFIFILVGIFNKERDLVRE